MSYSNTPRSYSKSGAYTFPHKGDEVAGMKTADKLFPLESEIDGFERLYMNIMKKKCNFYTSTFFIIFNISIFGNCRKHSSDWHYEQTLMNFVTCGDNAAAYICYTYKQT